MGLSIFDLSGKIAVVTGAGQGLGQGYAVNLAKAGATVICFNRSREKTEATLKLIAATGGKGAACYGDVTDVNSCRDALRDVKQQYGHIDILVNNAGMEIAEPIDQVTPEHFDSIMTVNIKGSFFMAKEAANYMAKQGSGKIINIASLGSYIGLAGSTVYCASKGAVLQFTKALAIELADKNIQVNAIAPGYFRTSMTEPFFQDAEHCAWINQRIPLGRPGTSDDLAGTVIFLASSASDYITGQTIIVDGGWLAS